MKQIKRLTNVEGIIGYDCPFNSLEKYIQSMYYTVKHNTQETNSKLQIHENMISEAEANIESLKRQFKQMTEKTELELLERKTLELAQIQKLE